MEPALDVINRALLGDLGARSFLEQTSSVYVLDATDISKPKTYGCWNFIHQAMNEVERYESKLAQGGQSNDLTNGAGLIGHVRLLASMASRVARRSPATDRGLVATCIANAEEYHGTASQSQWLVDLNLELREIVMGRIAAMAFDFGFHRKIEPHGHSAFGDRVVMDTFCAILSSNAVSSGPQAVRHFATEWVIPSSRNLPSFAVASVVRHLASEGMRKSAPAGTKDILQQLSVPVMSIVLIPALGEALSENSVDGRDPTASRQDSSRIAAMCLGAVKIWCDATDLSLPQLKHICSKNNVNIVGLISDAMYSDSQYVVDALAELVETTILLTDEKTMSEGRMDQVRHIMQVDESSFQTSFSPEQLKTIETKEMGSIVDELVSAVALQRFRFTERQNNGDHDVCRNLARIAASVCQIWLDIPAQEHLHPLEPGAISFLLKTASHPSTNICGLTLPVLSQVSSADPYVAQQLLPILQRRAIVPHRVESGRMSLAGLSDGDFHTFQQFRDHELTGALLACWRANSDNYMDSCTSAAEEFCSDHASVNVSLHLEAALYCIESVAADEGDSQVHFRHSKQLARCLMALSRKSTSMMANPLTLARMCTFLRKYSRWCLSEDQPDGLVVAADIVTSTFRLLLSSVPDRHSQEMLRESSISPVAEAALTIQELLGRYPTHFVTAEALALLNAVWEDSYATRSHNDTINIDVLIPLSIGICHVLASLPENQRVQSFQALVSPTLRNLEHMSSAAKASQSPNMASVLSQIADEIRILATMLTTFTKATSSEGESMESGCDTSPDGHTPVQEPVLAIVQKGWPFVVNAAANYCGDENISTAISTLLSALMPPDYDINGSMALLKDLCAVSSSMLRLQHGRPVHFESIFEFLEDFVHTHGHKIEKWASESTESMSVNLNDKEAARLLEDLMLNTIAATQASLGSVWTSPKEQEEGQSAFESRPSPAPKPGSISDESLGGMLSLTRKGLEQCPVFFLQLPAGRGIDRGDDILLRRAVTSAVASLNDTDPDIVLNAIMLLTAMVKLLPSHNENLQSFVSESLSRIRMDTINRLLMGCCGRYEYSIMGDAAELFCALARVGAAGEIEASIVAALSRDYFLLGDPAKNTTLAVLNRCSHSNVYPPELAVFLESLWRLHQVEDTLATALPGSDSVRRFLRMYGA